MLGNLIGGFIVILVGTSLAPTVAQQVGTAQADGNVTGAADTLLGLTTLFYSLAIATSAIGGSNCKPLKSENFYETAESRLISLRGQDRSVNAYANALETDKAYFTFYHIDNYESKIYSPNSEYKLKLENNKLIVSKVLISNIKCASCVSLIVSPNY